MDKFIKDLNNYNGTKKTLLKASEEFQELSLIITQRINKPSRVPDSKIIEEIGDCEIRLACLKAKFSTKAINDRVATKKSKLQGMMDSKRYKTI
ncbi:hypothetical protein N356_gp059 [Cellulophaga phage phi14:2]|uniref:Uncharacterized protein n=1 Tax=Cellulophaga phage phi14:2 TaxID=1327990 RepID=S0A0Q3_9CAUD|nr:hypothetical protein N356_gp059 [Cellulophaga phage phi14:2]AGO48951.1 hypothetical protein Phi14:2_gp073 [Cellulophaga phage phi14:2]